MNSEDIGGEGALIKASRWGHHSVMRTLLKAGTGILLSELRFVLLIEIWSVHQIQKPNFPTS